jgi:hypothetical protein
MGGWIEKDQQSASKINNPVAMGMQNFGYLQPKRRTSIPGILDIFM